MYIKINEDGSLSFPYTKERLRKDLKNVSFPKVITDEVAAEYNVFPVVYETVDNYDNKTQVVFFEELPVKENGKFVMRQKVRELEASEIELRYANAVSAVKSKRDTDLKLSDWAQVPDAPFTEAERAAILDYRQALRDITEQKGFPYDITWPEKPF